MRQGRRISPSDKADAVRSVQGGMKIIDAAREHDVSPSALSKWCKIAGVDVKPKKDYTVIDKLVGKVSDAEIAERVGKSTTFVRDRRLALGIPAAPRTQPKAQKTLDRLWQHHYDLQDIMKTWTRSSELNELIREIRCQRLAGLFSVG